MKTALPPYFGVFYLAWPAFIIYTISRVGGWPILARAYPLRGPAPKPATRMGYGTLGKWMGYNGSLIVGADKAGFYLASWPFLLSWCHAPLFIPWSEMPEARARRFLWAVYYKLELRSLPGFDLALRDRTFDLVRSQFVDGGVIVHDLP